MKKIISVFVVLSLMVGVLMLPISAVEPRWSNTSMVIMQHGYFNGSAECVIEIDGYSGATISNVDIRLDKVVGDTLVNVASWNDLSSGQYFTFLETVSGVELYCTYRLSFTAEVHRNGTVEPLDMHKDVYYTPKN